MEEVNIHQVKGTKEKRGQENTEPNFSNQPRNPINNIKNETQFLPLNVKGTGYHIAVSVSFAL